jgi:subtilisin family serine protease
MTGWLAAVVSLVATTAVPGSVVRAEPTTSPYIIVVNGDRAVDVVADHLDSAGVPVDVESKGAVDFVAADLDSRELADLRGRPGVRWVEPDAAVTIATEQTISLMHTVDNWGLDRVDQVSAALDTKFRYAADGTGVEIYILDTGIRRTHQEFTGRVAPGYVVPSVGSSTDDDCGHGTHVAGVAAGTRYGVAKQATIVPVKIFPGGSEAVCQAGTTVSAFLLGMQWIIDNHAPGTPAVVNLSLGTTIQSDALDAKVRAVVADGVAVVAAAGNDGSLSTSGGYIDSANTSTSLSPACTSRRSPVTSGILTVAATGGVSGNSFTRVDDEAYYSNHGPCVDLFAPGTDIKSAWPVAGLPAGDLDDPDLFGGYYADTGTYNKSGTSMASPFVAGAIAMLLQQTPTATPAEVTSRILANATANTLTILPRVGGGTASPNLLLYTCATNCVPSAPRNVVVSRVSRTEMSVAWDAPESTGGLDVTSYTATASTTGGANVSCTSTSSTCRLSGLVAGTAYAISVAATNAAGNGASSAVKTLAAGVVSTAPGTPTVVAGDGQVSVSWTAPTDTGGLPITGYTVTSTPESKTCSSTGAELTCVVTGLTIGTKYSFVVAATNEAGSVSSAASAAIAPALAWEYVPVFTSVTPGNGLVNLEWSEARVLGTAPAGYFTGYVVKDATGATVCATTALKCSVKKLKNATRVSFSVEATSIADSSIVAKSKEVLVGGLRQIANAMRKRSSAALTKVANTNSKGKVAWRVSSGGCRISRGIVTAPASGNSCKLRVSVAKSGLFPAQSLTITLKLV